VGYGQLPARRKITSLNVSITLDPLKKRAESLFITADEAGIHAVPAGLPQKEQNTL
jgi:hypothetical protein